MTDTEEAEWVAARVSAVRAKDQEVRERELTYDEITNWYKTKVRNYFRCITCPSQPVRERTHFQRRHYTNNTKPCRKQKLTQLEETAWITKQSATLRVDGNASTEAHRIIARRLKGSQHRAKKTHDNATHDVCYICTQRFPELPAFNAHHRCAVCHRRYQLETKSQRSNHRQRPDVALVCRSCRENGYTPNDIRAYECRNCKRPLGRKKFSASAIQNFIRRKRGILTCRRCSMGKPDNPPKAQEHAVSEDTDSALATPQKIEAPDDWPTIDPGHASSQREHQ